MVQELSLPDQWVKSSNNSVPPVTSCLSRFLASLQRALGLINHLISDGNYNNGNNKGILYGLLLLQQHQQHAKRRDKEE